MKRLTKHEIEKARILKAARTAIRLKHGLRADEEIYERLPDLEHKIDEALSSGKPLAVTIDNLLTD